MEDPGAALIWGIGELHSCGGSGQCTADPGAVHVRRIRSSTRTADRSSTHAAKAATLMRPGIFALNGCLALDFEFKSGRMNMTN